MARYKGRKLDGKTAKNPSEEQVYDLLKECIKRSQRVEYEPEKIPYTITSFYIPDYKISYKNGAGTVCYIEYKGNGRSFDSSVRQKMIAVKEQHPDKKFYIVFHSDGKVGPKRKDGTFYRQSDWAKKHGFEFCITKHAIPEEWFQ